MATNSKEKQHEYDAKRAGQRTRNWTVIFYPEDLPENWIELLNEQQMIKWVQSPLHDQDLNADGQPKKPHYHALFMFDSVKTKEQVSDMLQEVYGVSDNDTIIGVAAPQKVSDRGALIRYFCHLDNPEKAQYDVHDMVGYGGADPAELLRYSATETREMIIAMEEYIEEHQITELATFSKAIRYDYPEWHTLLATKMTMYFNAFIRSQRHIVYGLRVNAKTGEVIE